MAHDLRGTVEYCEDVSARFRSLLEHLRPSSLALSGGSTARTCYQAMRVSSFIPRDVWFSDERWVALSDRVSNEHQAREVWLDHITTNVHSMRGAHRSIEEAVIENNLELAAAGAIDLAHFGVGDDGHTASLFPGSVEEDDPNWIAMAGDSAHPHRRLTWTVGAIHECARHRVVTVAGEAKHAAWHGLLRGEDLPARHLDLATTTWLVDTQLRD